MFPTKCQEKKNLMGRQVIFYFCQPLDFSIGSATNICQFTPSPPFACSFSQCIQHNQYIVSQFPIISYDFALFPCISAKFGTTEGSPQNTYNQLCRQVSSGVVTKVLGAAPKWVMRIICLASIEQDREQQCFSLLIREVTSNMIPVCL